MAEKLLEESETLLIDTPYLRKMREMGRQEGVQEGINLGREQGLRETILEAVIQKFDPPVSDYRRLQKNLERIHGATPLQQILLALFDAPNASVILDMTAVHPDNGGDTTDQ